MKHFYNIPRLRRRFFYPSSCAIVNVYFTEGKAVVRPRRCRFYKQKEIKCSLKLNLLFGIKQNKLSRNLNETGAQNIDYNPNLLRFLTGRSVYLPKEATMDRIKLACTQTLFYFSYIGELAREASGRERARNSKPTPPFKSKMKPRESQNEIFSPPILDDLEGDRSLLFDLILSKIVGYAVAGHYHVQSETIFKL